MPPNMHHHVIEPRKIPTTIVINSKVVAESLLMDAKIPIKLNIVIGLVMVRKNVLLVRLIALLFFM